jgi:bisphosphoglycerate-dependent phosphoglycerate mutase
MIGLALEPFYFLRHGETDWNLEHRAMGSQDIPLNDRGISQGLNAAELLFYHYYIIVATLFGNSPYASDSMKQFQDNLEKITHESTAGSTVALVRGGKVF